MPSPSPDNFLDRPLLQQLAGPKAFRRGEDCFAENRVGHLHAGMDRAAAKVSGGRTYRVKLWRKRGELHHACNCAAGREEVFCEHCVAVGLAWLHALSEHTASAGQPPPHPPDGEAGLSREELQRHLRALDKDRLISLVLEATDYDDILRRRLLLEAIGVSRGGSPRRNAPAPVVAVSPDLDAYRQILREAIECPEYVDYDAMPDYAQGIEEAIYPLGELLGAGHAAAVIDLAEFALIELDKANEMVDGGDGLLNPIYDDLQHYHLEACRAARPDPEKLAARLLEYELEGGLGVFNNAAKAYAEVLGAPGRAAWRRRLVREWSSLPELAPGSRENGGPVRQPINHRRFQIQALMERLAESEGDLATLAAVKQRDLSSAHDFLSLAELYQTAGRPDESLMWAERGLRAFPDLPDRVGLRDFVATAYHRLNRHEDGVRLVWEEFARFSDLEHYRTLRAHALLGGGEYWPQWRERPSITCASVSALQA